jgi:hypothetical protein
LVVLLETLGATEQDLLVECGTGGFDYDSSPSQIAAFDLIFASFDRRSIDIAVDGSARCDLRHLDSMKKSSSH